MRQGNYRFGLYDALGSVPACAGLARDLFAFVRADADAATPREFRTFVASFDGPLPPDEATFEHLLWTTLQRLHDLDVVHHEWAPRTKADAADPEFAFSFAGTAFFVVGLHAASSRMARRFAWPTLVFNPHGQFDRLRETGRYPRFQQVIRTAERSLQGDINPMLADFGSRSEASQYSGRQVGERVALSVSRQDRDRFRSTSRTRKARWVVSGLSRNEGVPSSCHAATRCVSSTRPASRSPTSSPLLEPTSASGCRPAAPSTTTTPST